MFFSLYLLCPALYETQDFSPRAVHLSQPFKGFDNSCSLSSSFPVDVLRPPKTSLVNLSDHLNRPLRSRKKTRFENAPGSPWQKYHGPNRGAQLSARLVARLGSADAGAVHQVAPQARARWGGRGRAAFCPQLGEAAALAEARESAQLGPLHPPSTPRTLWVSQKLPRFHSFFSDSHWCGGGWNRAQLRRAGAGAGMKHFMKFPARFASTLEKDSSRVLPPHLKNPSPIRLSAY